MRVIVVGSGNQGGKRAKVAGNDLVATVDPFHASANYKSVEEVPPDIFDAALVCTPDAAKPKVLAYLLSRQKHVLVEKPLLAGEGYSVSDLQKLAEEQKVVCYTAYNHRFEPHILRVKQSLDEGWLGKVYQAKFFYGNGTARDVRNSEWRDAGLGVLSDLGSHLLDWTLQLFGKPCVPPQTWAAHRFENRAFDHYHFSFQGEPALDYEMTMLSWKNTFRFDLFAENGTLHVDCLCKWGVSTYIERRRVLPSGRPHESIEQLPQGDPTWDLEYQYFKNLCQNPSGNTANDIWIGETLSQLSTQAPL
jgi:predicted dehydrogenase